MFLDKDDLPPGAGYEESIRRELNRAGLFIFLVSPESVDKGYAITELEFARKRWRNPSGRVLPVVVAETPFEQIPEYLAAVTLLQPEGNLKAEVLAAVSEIAAARRRRWILMGLVVALLTSGSLYLALKMIGAGKEKVATDEESQPASDIVVEEPPCLLEAELRSGGEVLEGRVVLYVGYADGSGDSFILSTGAPGTIRGSRAGPWTVKVVDGEGDTLGPATLDGCPEAIEELQLNEAVQLVVTPR